MAYGIDKSHSSIAFSVRHMMFARVRGTFSKWETTVNIDDKDLSKSTVEVTVDVASIETGDAQRDTHLRSADFFDVEKQPKMTFKSKRVEAAGKDHWKVTGDLTIRGTTKEVALDVESLGGGKDPWGGQRMGFSARASIDRQEWGLTWNQALEAGGVLVSHKVDIEVDVQVVAGK
jgi:polyisoprenoid-binding protein YceI